MMKITIDEKVCHRHKMDFLEVLMSLFVRQGGDIKAVLDNLVNREVLVHENGKYLITQHWNDVVEEILCDSSNEISNERLEALALELRQYFPEGRTPDKKFIYRCNKKEIMQSLKRFFALFGNYQDEEIKEATKRYVANFRGNYAYMRIIKYFIIKDLRKDGGDIISDLATLLENKESEGDSANNTSEDWTTKLI